MFLLVPVHLGSPRQRAVKWLLSLLLLFVTAATFLTGDQPNFARCLAISWAGRLYVHFQGLLPPDGILPGA